MERTKAEVPDVTSTGLDEFKPRERVTKEVEEGSDVVGRGWSSNKRPQRGNLNRFSVKDDGEEVIVKFLEDEPFAGIYQHWILEQGNQRKAYVCLGLETCPLCAVGDKAKPADYFNIVAFSEEGPELQVWIASSDPSKAIQEKAESKNSSPINKKGLYFAVSKKKGKNGFFSYTVERVREDEAETWGFAPLTPEQIKDFESQMFTDGIIKISTRPELEEIARNLKD